MSTPTLKDICRIMAACALLGALSIAAALLLHIVTACLALQSGHHGIFAITVDEPAIPPGTPISLRLLSTLLRAPADLSLVWAFLALYRLMRLYAQGEVFSASALHQLHNIARGIAGYAAAILLLNPLAAMALTFAPGSAGHSLTYSLSSEDAMRLFLAAAVYVIAQVMDDARRLAEENARFI